LVDLEELLFFAAGVIEVPWELWGFTGVEGPAGTAAAA
jgi:hypothetical protein